jgi:hypothetical protein
MLQRSAGNRATTKLIADQRNLSRSAWDEFVFAVEHPIATYGIYGAEEPAEVARPSTSSLAVRFSVNLEAHHQPDISHDGLTENTQHEGSEVNAMRHTIWNALNARAWGTDIAQQAADAHEDDPHAIDHQDAATQSFPTLSAADQGVDLRNNIIGRDIGGSMLRSTTGKEVAEAVLRVFHDPGLWVAEQQPDRTYRAVRHQLSDTAFTAAALKLANLNWIGLTPSGAARWRAARDRERAVADWRAQHPRLH